MFEFTEKLELLRGSILPLVCNKLVHEDQTILVVVQNLKAGGFSMRLVILGPGTLMKLESLSARAGGMRDEVNRNCGSELAGPPSGGQVHSIRKNIVLPCSGPMDLHYGKNCYVQVGTEPAITCQCSRIPAHPLTSKSLQTGSPITVVPLKRSHTSVRSKQGALNDRSGSARLC